MRFKKDIMRVKEIMTTKVAVIQTGCSVAHAAEKMESTKVGALPVCDGEHLIGMITDRDILIRTTADGRDPKKTIVRDCMSQGIICCFEDQSPQEVQWIMQEKQIRRLPVLTREQQVVGIVSLSDLSKREPMNGSKHI